MTQEWTLHDFAAKMTRQAMETQAYHLDFLAHAVIQSTGLKPEELELVQQQTATGFRWYFRKRVLDQTAAHIHLEPSTGRRCPVENLNAGRNPCAN